MSGRRCKIDKLRCTVEGTDSVSDIILETRCILQSRRAAYTEDNNFRDNSSSIWAKYNSSPIWSWSGVGLLTHCQNIKNHYPLKSWIITVLFGLTKSVQCGRHVLHVSRWQWRQSDGVSSMCTQHGSSRRLVSHGAPRRLVLRWRQQVVDVVRGWVRSQQRPARQISHEWFVLGQLFRCSHWEAATSM